MISPLPGITATKPGSATMPLPGYSADLLDSTAQRIEVGGGLLAVTKPWPSMLRTIWGDDARYVQTYFSKWEGRPDLYFPGDGAKRDDDGYLWILGRVDDVLNVAGHRIGTMEVESALVEHPAVAEAAVVGKTHELKGQALACFVTLRDGRAASPELRRASGIRREKDRRTRAAGRHSVFGRSPENSFGENHAQTSARHRRRPRTRRHDNAGGSERRRQPQGPIRREGELILARRQRIFGGPLGHIQKVQ
jgi:acyl-coenzyme A synthetase/AMP-(fatty) acid ligase